MNNDELIRELDAFMTRHGLADSTFSLLATNDSHLIKRIRDNRPIRRSTILKVRKYIARYQLDHVA